MTADTDSGEVITLQEAIAYTAAYRQKYPNEVKAFFVGTNKLNLVLEQPGCMGIRIYNGYSVQESRVNMVIIGVGTDGEDLVNGVILEHLIPCPKFCSKNSPLTE
jgi:hypothetical protein